MQRGDDRDGLDMVGDDSNYGAPMTQGSATKLLRMLRPFKTFKPFNAFGGKKVPTFKVASKTHAAGGLPRFGNSRNIECKIGTRREAIGNSRTRIFPDV